MSSLRIYWAVFLVFVGCGSNVVFLELLVKRDPGIGNSLTFLAFLFNSAHGLLSTVRFFRVPPSVPISAWTKLVIIFFIVSVLNNYALGFNVSMPLVMIFRSGSLLANMILGFFILQKRYTLIKYLSVCMISAGIAVCTIVSGRTASESSLNDSDGFVSWLTGILLLAVSLFLSALLGIFQEKLYAQYGKHPMEALFYSHFIALPGFIVLTPDIIKHLVNAFESEPIYLGVNVPILVLYLIANVLTQYVCISSVFFLTAECSSLTVTLVLTLRKFTSILFSIWYFQNSFTVAHWIGTILVFSGTALFTDVYQAFFSKAKHA